MNLFYKESKCKKKKKDFFFFGGGGGGGGEGWGRGAEFFERIQI